MLNDICRGENALHGAVANIELTVTEALASSDLILAIKLRKLEESSQ